MDQPPRYFGKPPKSYDATLAFLALLPRRTCELGRFAWVAARTWTRVGARLARLRIERLLLSRRCRRLQFTLGGAAMSGDEHGVEALRTELSGWIARRDGCTRRSRAVVGRARLGTKDERAAIAPTRVREPQKMKPRKKPQNVTAIGSATGQSSREVGDPGFEPGTSALSERRSNQLS